MKNPDFWAKSGPNPDHFAQKSPDPDQSPEIRTKVGALGLEVQLDFEWDQFEFF